MVLALLKQFAGQDFGEVSQRVVWGPVLPQDTSRQASTEQLLVQSGIHSRRHAMDNMGVQDPDREFTRWMEERRKILQMNLELRARSTRGGERERTPAAGTEGIE